ncbi:MAG TPA: Flp family type IVb pilin, partial [Syntrophomonadaceae bacterium]|nr:Flp family type IVb pilin [Syntrophomonadaceae bacterium]
MNLVKRLIKEEEGQGMIEYVLIVALISIVAIAAINLVGGKVSNTWTNVGNHL